MIPVIDIPPVIYHKCVKYIDSFVLEDLWEKLLNAYLSEKKLDTINIINSYIDNVTMSKVIAILCIEGICESVIDNGYTTISITDEFMSRYITDKKKDILAYKRNKYMLSYRCSSVKNITKTKYGLRQVGLIREGFKKASNHSFFYDIDMLNKYKQEIIEDLKKGLSSSTKTVTYQEIIDTVVDTLEQNRMMSLNTCYSDSRGRAIFSCTKKICNPIASKPFRALVKINVPKTLTKEGLTAIYQFITELCGVKYENEDEKYIKGIELYTNRYIPEDVELYQKIWLERIYNQLEKILKYPTYGWDIPIELDCRASAIEIIGLLLNDETYLTETKILDDGKYHDFWHIDGVRRDLVKKACTPLIYGSSLKPKTIWTSLNLDYTQEELNIMMNTINHGKLRLAEKFKTFIINNVNPSSVMKVKIHNDEFTIYCNKTLPSAVYKNFLVYSSKHKIFRTIRRSDNYLNDLNRFKTYFVTLLIHNLDSQVSNKISYELDWCIPIHDAWNIHPNSVDTLRNTLLKEFKNIYANRESILRNYYESIGINPKNAFYGENQINNYYNKLTSHCLK